MTRLWSTLEKCNIKIWTFLRNKCDFFAPAVAMSLASNLSFVREGQDVWLDRNFLWCHTSPTLECSTTLPNTQPTFRVKVLTWTGIQIARWAPIAILRIFLLFETLKSSNFRLFNAIFFFFFFPPNIWRVAGQKCTTRHNCSLLQTTLSELKSFLFLGSISFWAQTWSCLFP